MFEKSLVIVLINGKRLVMNMDQKEKVIGLGIVGSGSIAQTHAAAVGQLAGVRLVGVSGRNSETSDKLAKDHDTVAFESVETLLEVPELDAILIATPSGAHLEPALMALDKGKHVLCEKPLEITVERTREMLEKAKEKNRLLGGFFPMRTSRAAEAIKAAVDAGRFGRLTFVSARVKWWRDSTYYTDSTWRGTYKLDGGGALINQAIHAVDLLQWLGGRPRAIFANAATLAHQSIEVEDTLSAMIAFEHGGLGTIEASTAVYPGLNLSLEISGDQGSAILENDKLTLWKFREEREEDETIRENDDSAMPAGVSDPKAIGCEGHRRQIEAFCQAIKGETNEYVDGWEAASAVSIVEACYRSAKGGQMEKVHYLS